MEKYRKGIILIGVSFGMIAFAVCAIFMSWQIALPFGVFTAGVYMLVISLVVYRQVRKHDNDGQIAGEILLKEAANYYHNGKLICSGLLYLTQDCLLFISHEKKQTLKEEIPITSLVSVQYGVLLKHIRGLKLAMNDGSEKGYLVGKAEDYITKLNALMGL